MKLKYLGKDTGVIVPKERDAATGRVVMQKIEPGATFDIDAAEGARLLSRFNLPLNKKTGIHPPPRFEEVVARSRKPAAPAPKAPAAPPIP
jgi:hypothetical protein